MGAEGKEVGGWISRWRNRMGQKGFNSKEGHRTRHFQTRVPEFRPVSQGGGLGKIFLLHVLKSSEHVVRMFARGKLN